MYNYFKMLRFRFALWLLGPQQTKHNYALAEALQAHRIAKERKDYQREEQIRKVIKAMIEISIQKEK